MYNLLFLGFTQFVNYALVYIFTWFVTNQFDAATAGTYFLALSICHGLYVIVKWGWGQATLRYCSLCNNNDTETSLSFLFYSLKKIAMRAIIILILVAAFSRYISDFYSKPNLEVAIWGLAFFIVAKPFNEIIIQYLRVCGFIKTFSVLQYVVGPISKICSLLLLTKIIFGVFPISVSSSISEIVVGILCLFILFYLGNKKNTKHCQYFNKLNKKEVHGYVKNIGHNLLLVYLLTKADVAISGFWLVKEEIASYQVAKQLATIVALFLMAFEPFVSPAIARMIGQTKKKNYKQVIN